MPAIEESVQQAATAGLMAALRLPDPALMGTAAVALGHAGLRWAVVLCEC